MGVSLHVAQRKEKQVFCMLGEELGAMKQSMDLADSLTICERKGQQRRWMRRRRAQLWREEQGKTIDWRALLSELPLSDSSVVAGYWPIRSEFDPREGMAWLYTQGHTLSLPVVVGEREPLVFREWTPGMQLEEGAWGVKVPASSSIELIPTVVLVPLLAFSEEGGRLGYGGGFYDRTLARLRQQGEVLAVGLGFAGQELADLVVTSEDERLDWMVTEKRVWSFSESRIER